MCICIHACVLLHNVICREEVGLLNPEWSLTMTSSVVLRLWYSSFFYISSGRKLIKMCPLQFEKMFFPTLFSCCSFYSDVPFSSSNSYLFWKQSHILSETRALISERNFHTFRSDGRNKLATDAPKNHFGCFPQYKCKYIQKYSWAKWMKIMCFLATHSVFCSFFWSDWSGCSSPSPLSENCFIT